MRACCKEWGLTPREARAFESRVAGRSVGETCVELGMRPATYETRVRGILKEEGSRTRGIVPASAPAVAS